MKEIVIFYVELLIYLDGEESSIVAVGMDSAECTERAYNKLDELETLGHKVIVDELGMGIL